MIVSRTHLNFQERLWKVTFKYPGIEAMRVDRMIKMNFMLGNFWFEKFL